MDKTTEKLLDMFRIGIIGAGWIADKMTQAMPLRQKGLLESPMMPHKETISIMRQMDELRKEWGVNYPYDETI